MELQPSNSDLLLNSKEAARFLRASRAKLYRLIKSGEIVGHKVGGTWVFYKRDLIAYVERAPNSHGAALEKAKQQRV